MFLSKHKSGFYYVYYETSNGKRRSKSTKTKHKKDAIKFLNRFSKIIEEEFYQEVKPITIKRFSFEYLRKSEPHLTWKTIKAYKTTFKMVLNHFGDVYLTDLSKQKVEEYLLKRATEVSLFVARRDLTNLSAAFNKAVSDGYLKENPCKGIKRYKLPETEPRFYKPEEFEKLISVMNDEDMRDLTIFAVNTGFRQMELLSMVWGQVNFEERLITLDNRAYITKTKRIRSIPLNPDAYEILVKRFARKIEGIEKIFTRFGKPINQNRISHNFKKYVYDAKINPKLNFHSLRHTFASWLVQSGVSIYVVSKLLGHSNVQTTEIYAHLRRDDLFNAVNSITQKRLVQVASE